MTFDLKNWWNLVLYFLFLLFFCLFILFCLVLLKLLVRAHKPYNIQLKVRNNNACVSKKTVTTKIHPSRKPIFTRFLNVSNIDESSLMAQTAINILDYFHSSLSRKKICRGLNTLLHSNIHSSEPIQNPVRHLRRRIFAKIVKC